MAHTLKTLAICGLGLSACLRFGYAERQWAAGGGASNPADAATQFDASMPRDAATPFDASTSTDAAASFDASTVPAFDAAAARDATASIDATAAPDATHASDATTPDDASPGPDAATTVDSGTPCASSPVIDYCTQLPALLQPPALDGTLDCGPSLIDLPRNSWSSSGTLPSDNHARYAAAWRPDGLYVYIEVDDSLLLPALASHVDPWCGDGVELYADSDGRYVSAPDFDNPGAIQLLATSPSRTPGTALAVDARYHTRSQRRVANWAASRHIAIPRGNGYALEAFITAPDLDLSSWTLTAGNTVGFDIAINVSVTSATQTGDCGYSLGQYYLRLSRTPCTQDSCRPFSNATAFCTASLL